MKIIVASLNKQKISAVEETIKDYPMFFEATVVGLEVSTGVSDQPKSLNETVQGAINRAKSSWGNCDYSIGIESGVVDVPFTKTGMMDTCVCAIYDGKEIHLGLSSAFEPPKLVAKYMHEGMNMSDATFAAGLTENKNIGASEGLVGILTNGRLTRLGYTKQALTTALIHLENEHLYKQ